MSGDPKSYFLGVEGEQLGPLSENEVISQIKDGSISPQSLIWWEGQSDWQPIVSIDSFKLHFESPPSVLNPVESLQTNYPSTPQNNLPAKSPRKKSDATASKTSKDLPFISYAPQGSEPTPVFGVQEAKIATEPLVSKQSLIMGVVFIALALAGWLALQIIPSGTSTQPQVAKKDPKKSQNKDGIKTQRKLKLSQASAALLLNPTQSLQTLNELVNQDIKDEVGLEAAQILLNYFQKNNQIELAGDLLLRLDRPDEAADNFLKEARLVSKAENSLFLAFKKTQGKESADFLIRDINLLINPLKNFNLAKERIELFEKTFPALTHPFGYYSLPIDQKIQTTFVALSRSFVDEVTRTIKEEFPQINLEGRPVVEVKKDATGNYRIISRYQGDLLLRSDRINGIYFLYWLIDGIWVLVDTNLTKERQAFAASMRKKYETRVSSPSDLLALLEGRFNSQFPDQALHELSNLQKTVKPLKKN